MAELITAKVNTATTGSAEAAPVAVGMIDATKLLDQKPMARMSFVSADFAITAEPVVEPVTLQQAKDHLRVVFDDEDDYISSLIVAARQMAEGRTNRTITQRIREQAFSHWCAMKLLKPPFVSVESVSYFDADGVEQVLSPDNYAVSTRREPASVSLAGDARSSAPSLASQEEAVIVRYTAGYPVGEVPAPIVQWMLLQIGSMYEHRESVIAGVSVTPLPEMYERLFLQPYMVYE